MKKLLLVYPGFHNPSHALKFSLQVAKSFQFEIEVVFIEDDSDDGSFSYPFPNDMSLTEEVVTSETRKEEDQKLLLDNLQYIKDEAAAAGIPILHTEGFSVEDLIELSNEAAVVVLDADYNNTILDIGYFAKHSVCPVLALSSSSSKPDKVIFAFDGSDQSEFAIRQYCELFPRLPAEHLLVSVDRGIEMLDYEDFVNGFLSSQLQDLQVVQLGNEKNVFVDYIRSKGEEVLVVMGAFGRSGVSQFFKPSFATPVMSDTRASLFLANNRG